MVAGSAAMAMHPASPLLGLSASGRAGRRGPRTDPPAAEQCMLACAALAALMQSMLPVWLCRALFSDPIVHTHRDASQGEPHCAVHPERQSSCVSSRVESAGSGEQQESCSFYGRRGSSAASSCSRCQQRCKGCASAQHSRRRARQPSPKEQGGLQGPKRVCAPN